MLMTQEQRIRQYLNFISGDGDAEAVRGSEIAVRTGARKPRKQAQDTAHGRETT